MIYNIVNIKWLPQNFSKHQFRIDNECSKIFIGENLYFLQLVIEIKIVSVTEQKCKHITLNLEQITSE